MLQQLEDQINKLPHQLVEQAKVISNSYSHTRMWKHILSLQEKRSKSLNQEVAVYSLASLFYMFNKNILKEIFKTCSFCFLTKVDCTKCKLSCTANKMFCFMMENDDMLNKQNILTWLGTMNYWEVLTDTYNKEL